MGVLWEEFPNLLREQRSFNMRDPKFCFPCKSIFTNLLLLRQIELEEKKRLPFKKTQSDPNYLLTFERDC